VALRIKVTVNLEEAEVCLELEDDESACMVPIPKGYAIRLASALCSAYEKIDKYEKGKEAN
jgi:hypothetical protein